MVLHVTNGDVLATRLSKLGFQGVILPWREILHEGPLPAYTSFDEAGRRAFNAERAAYIIGKGWGTPEDVVFDMDQRDKLILDRSWSEVFLWFERDLYDQLSLAQILTLMKGGGSFREGGVILVHSDQHFGSISDDALKARFDRRRMVDQDLCDHYVKLFTAVGSGADPEPDASAPKEITEAVAMWRTLQPDDEGMSDLDRQLLAMIKRSGTIGVSALFTELQSEHGDQAFMSDLAFVSRITALAERTSQIELMDDAISWKG